MAGRERGGRRHGCLASWRYRRPGPVRRNVCRVHGKLTATSQVTRHTPPDARPAHILVVDDEPAITELLSTALRYLGYQVTSASTGFAALDAAANAAPDLVVLDVMLPDLDGFEVCRRLRAAATSSRSSSCPRATTEDDRVTGFIRGGDDYVTKPFSLEELVAADRRAPAAGRPRPRAMQRACASRDLELDEDRHQVWRDGQRGHAVADRVPAAALPAAQPERVLSKQQILDHVWQYDFNGDDNVVETYISYLRRKLDDGDAALLRTVRGFGYVLRTDDAA